MPSISTHLNFAQRVLTKEVMSFDQGFFTLGSIAPDSADIINDDKAFRGHHFVLTGSLSDLNFFLDFTRKAREKSKHDVQSFLDGYYAHLWLDSFTLTHEDDLKIAAAPDVFKATIRFYDMLDIKDFLTQIEDPTRRLKKIPGLEFLSLTDITVLWKRFINSVIEYDYGRPRQIVFTKEEYNVFLNKAVTEYVKDLQKYIFLTRFR